MVGSMDM